MSIFSLGRKPRQFHHVPIFYDERNDRLRAIEQKARHKADQDGTQPLQPEDLRGTFVQGTTHLRRSKEHAGRWTNNIGIITVMILALALVWYYLMR